MEEKWVLLLPANPYTWYAIKQIERVAEECGTSKPKLSTLNNLFGDVVCFVVDTTEMDEFEEASIMQAMPTCHKRMLPHLR